ncbi:MAG: ATP-binding cassette domain-containing protein [Candidatus Heimdallarchaeota archaeon]|nr:ATP-binding cassette domain-containing protein [Candidatus Heimdallarchaeota archaeon]
MVIENEIIVVEGMTKRYGKKGSFQVLALDNVSFSMKPGANSLLGPNGAGKSTLIKILLGFINPDAGEAQVLGYDIKTEGRELRKHIGYMPENFSLIPGVNAVKQVSLLGKIAGLPAAEAMQRAHETLQYVGLDEERYRSVEEFSTGMLQRLKLAQALVNDPELLILDEPTNGLDPQGRVEMIDLIYEISHRFGKNIVVSSHLLPDVEATCDYTTILNHGQIVEQGKISDLTGSETANENVHLMNVEIKGSLNDFLLGLQKEKIPFKVVEKKIQIPYQDDLQQTIFDIAYDTGVQIRSLALKRAILEDVFVHTIEDQERRARSLTHSGGK